MGIRPLMWTVVAAIFLSTTARPAWSQGLPPQTPQADFKLTNQPLFGSGEPQSTAAQRTQRDPEQGFGFGIKGGPLFSRFNQEGATFENKTGFIGGIWFGGNRPGIVGVEGEVLYARKGARSGNFDTKLSYLEIPILIRINVGTQSVNKWVVYGLVGPVFDIKLKAELESPTGVLDVGSNYAGFQIGVIAGAGVEIFRFLVEGRGNWGLRDVRGGDLGTSTKIRDKSFALLFGIRLN